MNEGFYIDFATDTQRYNFISQKLLAVARAAAVAKSHIDFPRYEF